MANSNAKRTTRRTTTVAATPAHVAMQQACNAAGAVAVAPLPSNVALALAPQHNPQPEVVVPPAPVVGKYGKVYAKLGLVSAATAPNWRYAATPLKVGPYMPQKATSVFGRLYALVAANPGVNGAQLVALMQQHGAAFASTAAVKYAGNGQLCGMWCQGYINGALRASHGHLAVA